MNQHEQLLSLCAGFYDAALDPSAWSGVLSRVATCLGAVGADLHLLDDDVLRCNYMGMQPTAVLAEYSEKFLDREPRSLNLRRLMPGQVITDLHIVDAQTMRNHPYYADFVIWDKIIFEAKAVEQLTDPHIKQVLNYLAASKLHLGLLVNFGGDSLEWKRVVL